MPDPGYFLTALAAAVAITVGLRALPFLMVGFLRDSAFLADLGRWMPLGAVAILAASCLFTIDLEGHGHGVPEVAGLAATIGMHVWRRNALASIAVGTGVCLALANLVPLP